MLRRAAAEDLPFIRKLCADSIIGCKILCQVLAYGFERDFLEVWIMQENDVVTAIITKFYDDAALVADEAFDEEQLCAFFDMFDCNTVMLSHKVAVKLGFDKTTVKNGYKFNGSVSDFTVDSLVEEDLRAAYELISREIPGSFKQGREAYLSFISDFTFRQRRSMARGVCTHSNGSLTSVAVTSCETERSAVISGVACDSSQRKKGLGKLTVLSMVEKLLKDGKMPYVIALNESAEGFYEHIGFIKSEMIVFTERKKDV